jgi:transposase
MRQPAAVIRLSDEEAKTLEEWTRRGKKENRLVERARIVLLANAGRTNQQIAEVLRTRTARVSKWRQRFGAKRLEGLGDAARSGKPAKYDKTTEKRVLALLDEPAPKGYSQWNGRLLAEALPGVSKDQVWRILRRHEICLERRRSWCISTDPEFGAKAADVVGLYLNPPDKALVLAVDEKPSIQALERAQGYLRLPDGKAVNGFSHCYKRHGTTTLFAALEITTGLVKTAHYKRRRRREFLDFMNEIVAAHPDRENPCCAGQLEYAQAERGSLVEAPFQRSLPLHSHLFVLAQSGGGLVQHPEPASPSRRQLHLARTTATSHRRLRQGLQRKGRSLRVEEGRGVPFSPKT